MPELPEVETVRREIDPLVRGQRILSLVAHWPKTVVDLSSFAQRIRGTRIAATARRGKWILLELDGSRGALAIHLRMSGRLELRGSADAPSSHERAALELERGQTLAFIDPRKFGRIRHIAAEVDAALELGLEPLSGEFTSQALASLCFGRRGRLKPFLLDQRRIAGLGNIYVDEALHRAGLHPLEAPGSLGQAAIDRLHQAIQAVLQEAILAHGSSFDAFYRTPSGAKGSYQERLCVYGRAGEPCRTCSAALERSVVQQRGTTHCPRCQPRLRRAPRAASADSLSSAQRASGARRAIRGTRQ